MATININTDIEIEIVCDKCGGSLEATTDVSSDLVRVEPCEDCLTTAHNEGYEKRSNEAEAERE